MVTSIDALEVTPRKLVASSVKDADTPGPRWLEGSTNRADPSPPGAALASRTLFLAKVTLCTLLCVRAAPLFAALLCARGLPLTTDAFCTLKE